MENWIPAFAGMTDFGEVGDQTDLAEVLLSSPFQRSARPESSRLQRSTPRYPLAQERHASTVYFLNRTPSA